MAQPWHSCTLVSVCWMILPVSPIVLQQEMLYHHCCYSCEVFMVINPMCWYDGNDELLLWFWKNGIVIQCTLCYIMHEWFTCSTCVYIQLYILARNRDKCLVRCRTNQIKQERRNSTAEELGPMLGGYATLCQRGVSSGGGNIFLQTCVQFHQRKQK